MIVSVEKMHSLLFVVEISLSYFVVVFGRNVLGDDEMQPSEHQQCVALVPFTFQTFFGRFSFFTRFQQLVFCKSDGQRMRAKVPFTLDHELFIAVEVCHCLFILRLRDITSSVDLERNTGIYVLYFFSNNIYYIHQKYTTL